MAVTTLGIILHVYKAHNETKGKALINIPQRYYKAVRDSI
jgi:hypothetical protein